jgi:hypothetical protein
MGGRLSEPRIVEIPNQKMAVVRSVGDPNEVGQSVLGALYGAAYSLKFDLKKKGVDYKVGAPRARWPDILLAPKSQWTGLWAIPVPQETESLVQKAPGVPVTLETWEYGTVAQVLHIGPYSEEEPTIRRLHEFIAANGYVIAGDHEEEYLTRPSAKVQKTIVRYIVRKAASEAP